MSMCTVSEGWWVSISLASSTMEIRWPIAGVGYRTIASSSPPPLLLLLQFCVCVRERERERGSRKKIYLIAVLNTHRLFFLNTNNNKNK
jgi:hypothetical protein